MANNFFSQIRSYTSAFLRYLLFFLNLALLAWLGIKTAKAWVSDPFDFLDILDAYPSEPEFLDRAAAEKQFWMALSFETIVFIIGGFICYEILIKKKTIRRGLIAPLVIAFLWLTGESAFFFMPATDKQHTISVCTKMGISWNTKRGRCNLMDLETQRFARMAAAKKAKKKAVVLPVKASPVKSETTPRKHSDTPAKPAAPAQAPEKKAVPAAGTKKASKAAPAAVKTTSAKAKKQTPDRAQAAPKPAAPKAKKAVPAKEEKPAKPAVKTKPVPAPAPEKKPAAKKAVPVPKKQAKPETSPKTKKNPAVPAEKTIRN